MKKRLKKKLSNQNVKVYRGIAIWENHSYGCKILPRSYRVMIMLPTIEVYSKGTSGLRSDIDKFLKTYQPTNEPF